MRHAVVTADLLHSDIRPAGMRRRFRDQAVRDAGRFFPADSLRRLASCPACRSETLESAFERHGFEYLECGECESVFAAARPSREALSRYFREAEAGRLRVEYLSAGDEPQVTDVLRGRFEWVATVLSGRAQQANTLVDIGTSELFVVTELLRRDVCRHVYSSEPAVDLVEPLEAAGVRVVEGLPPADAATALEQLEHAPDPAGLVATLRESLAPDGVLFLTTRSVSGFDLQVLWGQSPYIFFPEHLNLFSIEGLQALLERNGFVLSELSTPGHLDLDLIRQAREDDSSVALPRFLRQLLEKRSVLAQREFQEFLQKAQLSSHARVVAEVDDEVGAT